MPIKVNFDEYHLHFVSVISLYLKCVLVCVFPDQEEDYLQPVSVQELLLVSLVETDDPPTTILVPRILPVGEDSLLEQGIVGPDGQLAGDLDVVVERPEVLDGGHGDDGSLVLLPGPRFVVLKEPEGPSVLKRMLDVSLRSLAVRPLDLVSAPVDNLGLAHPGDQVIEGVCRVLRPQGSRIDACE